jgi:hypothetical protein
VTTKFNAAVGQRAHEQRAARRHRLGSLRQSVAGRGGRLRSDEKAPGASQGSRRYGGEFIERIYKMVSAMLSATVLWMRFSPLPIK